MTRVVLSNRSTISEPSAATLMDCLTRYLHAPVTGGFFTHPDSDVTGDIILTVVAPRAQVAEACQFFLDAHHLQAEVTA